MDAIDQAADQFGMPMGPIALKDLVGLDTAVLRRQGAGRTRIPTAVLQRRSSTSWSRPAGSARNRARASASSADKGKPAEADPAFAAILAKHRTASGDVPDADEITDRLFLPMLLEATRVLEEGIVREPAMSTWA